MITVIEPGPNSNINVYAQKINWPWFHFMKSRHVHGLEGVRIPRRFGRAYVEYDMDVDVFYIIPINLIVAFWRAASLRIKWIWPRNLQAYEHEVAKVVRRRIESEAPKNWEAGYAAGKIDGAREEYDRIVTHFGVKKDG